VTADVNIRVFITLEPEDKDNGAALIYYSHKVNDNIEFITLILYSVKLTGVQGIDK